MTSSTTISLRTTIAALKPALSRMPITRTAVMKSTTSAAGRVQYEAVAIHMRVAGSVSEGVAVHPWGGGVSKTVREEREEWGQPCAPVLEATAVSSTRAH